jgi:hypothetical protein
VIEVTRSVTRGRLNQTLEASGPVRARTVSELKELHLEFGLQFITFGIKNLLEDLHRTRMCDVQI